MAPLEETRTARLALLQPRDNLHELRMQERFADPYQVHGPHPEEPEFSNERTQDGEGKLRALSLRGKVGQERGVSRAHEATGSCTGR